MADLINFINKTSLPSLTLQLPHLSIAELTTALMTPDHASPILARIPTKENKYTKYSDYSSISNLIMLYLYVHRPSRRANKSSKKDYFRQLIPFLQYLYTTEKTDMRELSLYDMKVYQEQLTGKYRKSSTRAKKIILLQAFTAWCFKLGYLTDDLSKGLASVIIKKEEVPEKDINHNELTSAIEFYKANPKIQSLIMILATTGLRLQEIAESKWCDLLVTDSGKHYLIVQNKRGSTRRVFILNKIIDLLMEYRQTLQLGIKLDKQDPSPFYPNRYGNHYRTSTLSASISKRLSAAGLTTIDGHRITSRFLKHYFAHQTYANGATIEQIRAALDHYHYSDRTMNHYLANKLRPEKDASDYVNLEFLNVDLETDYRKNNVFPFRQHL
ncbi:site-specific recombinase XerD [Paenibacillus phyllosphaerae]|uniref:Site-specific recombinase XerD n=1 Tax=Paenibacillus phyllosphaerae TaxID=274593 RepID=A0A7W5FP93_9BACL|nr:site-specific integrase [Paenibacillus phyllosphaerae]MBB3112120.1 site-specific recombinase XerD [Paenibacillus phyllosphaerae]